MSWIVPTWRDIFLPIIWNWDNRITLLKINEVNVINVVQSSLENGGKSFFYHGQRYVTAPMHIFCLVRSSLEELEEQLDLPASFLLGIVSGLRLSTHCCWSRRDAFAFTSLYALRSCTLSEIIVTVFESQMWTFTVKSQFDVCPRNPVPISSNFGTKIGFLVLWWFHTIKHN